MFYGRLHLALMHARPLLELPAKTAAGALTTTAMDTATLTQPEPTARFGGLAMVQTHSLAIQLNGLTPMVMAMATTLLQRHSATVALR
jgi:hypothetical protein